MRGEESLHFGWRTEMVFAVQVLFGMGLAEQGEGADALDNVIFPAVGRRGVVNGKGGDAGKPLTPALSPSDGERELLAHSGVVDFEIKAAGEEGTEFGRRAEGEEAAGGGRGIEN
jgi:hypothetical protein